VGLVRLARKKRAEKRVNRVTKNSGLNGLRGKRVVVVRARPVYSCRTSWTRMEQGHTRLKPSLDSRLRAVIAVLVIVGHLSQSWSQSTAAETPRSNKTAPNPICAALRKARRAHTTQVQLARAGGAGLSGNYAALAACTTAQASADGGNKGLRAHTGRGGDACRRSPGGSPGGGGSSREGTASSATNGAAGRGCGSSVRRAVGEAGHAAGPRAGPVRLAAHHRHRLRLLRTRPPRYYRCTALVYARRVDRFAAADDDDDRECSVLLLCCLLWELLRDHVSVER
jgi:hypothetical protein